MTLNHTSQNGKKAYIIRLDDMISRGSADRFYSRNPESAGWLDGFTSSIFEKIPEEAKIRYEEEPYCVTRREQFEFLKYFIHLPMVVHHMHGHVRRFAPEGNKPREYYSHLKESIESESRYGVSVVALSATSMHDLIEEVESHGPLNIKHEDLDTEKKKREYRLQNSAISAGIMYAAYLHFQRFPNPERFSPLLNSVGRVLNFMTRKLDENYFLNMSNLFDKTHEKGMYVITPRDFPKVFHYFENLFPLSRRPDFKRYIFEVYNHVPRENTMEKDRRRAIMASLADDYANTHDLDGAPISHKAKTLAKDLVEINDTSRIFARMRTEHSKGSMNKIMKQLSDLEAAITGTSGDDGIIGPILKVVRRDIAEAISHDHPEMADRLAQGITRRIDAELKEYRTTEYFSRRTNARSDPFIFAGTMDRIISVLMRWEKDIFHSEDPRSQYIFFSMILEQMKTFQKDQSHYISGLWTRIQKDLPSPEQFMIESGLMIPQ